MAARRRLLRMYVASVYCAPATDGKTTTVNVGTATVTYFLPTLIVELGFTGINAQGMTVAPYVAGWFLVVLQAWHSVRPP